MAEIKPNLGIISLEFPTVGSIRSGRNYDIYLLLDNRAD
jgi:hypothetical protein